MNEGPGHVPLHKIPENMAKQLEWWVGGGGGDTGDRGGRKPHVPVALRRQSLSALASAF